ncbi:TonB-dependent receptor [Oleiharenicola sp. Vm1]|uniref:TonB-dependent receptor n=1 Tax=Oleiharenicola sp. Vm1 TaxID=3398393 RepID=UPI0039F4773A
MAQTAAASNAAPADDKVLKLDKFEVTGSYIPFAGTQTALPVTTLDTKAIEATGITSNVLEVLRKAAPQFSGNGNLGNSNANISSGSTGGGSQVAFRNTQTLVLVNGRRMAYAPILASGGFQYVDVNLIPIAAIQRIDILQDGASATYGTDAVAGVVNIVLKSDYKGAEINAHYGFSSNTGKYEERSFSVVGGAGSDKTNVTFSAESSQTDPIFNKDRTFSNPSYGTPSFGGVVNTRTIPNVYYVLKPGLNAPPAGHTDLATLVAQGIYIQVNSSNLISGLGNEQQYAFNLSEYVTMILQNKRNSATLNFDHKVNDDVTFFGDMLYTQTNTFSQLNAQPISAVVAATSPSNPTNQTMLVRNRFVDHPRQYYYDTTTIRGILGAKGKIGDKLTWETAANKNIVDQNYTNNGVVNAVNRAAAVDSGLINLAARQQAAGAVDASGIFGTALGKATSTLTTYDARVAGELFELPGGPVGFAVGGEYRTETLKQTSDVYSQTATFGWESATTLDPFNSSRTVSSMFAEARVPIVGANQNIPGIHSLELDTAVRYEKYSDTDDPTVPKFSLSWRPMNEELLIRATYSKSFSAPTLFNLFGPGGIGFTDSLSLDKFGGGSITGQANARSGANPNLKPSRSKNYTFGFVWSPKAIKGLSVTVDYFDIKQVDLISTIGAATILQDVELNGSASPYARFVQIGSFGGTAISAKGQIGNSAIDDIYVTDTLVNIASQKLKGVDFKLDYNYQHDQWGRFDAQVSVGYYSSYSVQSLPGTDPFETVGLASNTNGTIPRWQSYSSLAWSRGHWRANLGWQHIPGVTDVNGDGSDRYPIDVKSYDAFDISASYTFGSEWKLLNGLTARAGVNNVFNKMPPIAGGTFTDSNADIGTYNPIGRLFFVEAKYAF